jgi:hypothetical protein
MIHELPAGLTIDMVQVNVTKHASLDDTRRPAGVPEPSRTRWDYFPGGRLRRFSLNLGRPTETPPDAILERPMAICTACRTNRVLPELRVIAGGRCWGCYVASVAAVAVGSIFNIDDL